MGSIFCYKSFLTIGKVEPTRKKVSVLGRASFSPETRPTDLHAPYEVRMLFYVPLLSLSVTHSSKFIRALKMFVASNSSDGHIYSHVRAKQVPFT